MTKRFSLSLVEVTVAMLLLLMGLGLFTSGYLRSRKSVEFRQSVKRLKSLCLQARRFSALTAHQGRVILLNKEGRWIGYLSLLASAGSGNGIRELTKKWGLEGIDTIKIRDSSLSEIQLLFYSRRGLYTIEAKDSYGRHLSSSDLGIDGKEFDDSVADLEMVIVPTAPSLSSLHMDLKPFIARVYEHAPFPNDLQKAS